MRPVPREIRDDPLVRAATLAALAASLSGCLGLHAARLAPGEAPTLSGPPVRENSTPLDPAFACFARQVSAAGARAPVIAVGDVRDFTGKYSVSEGTAITQGGALMVASALGKLGGAVVMAERFDPAIAERELGYVDRRQLGDGQTHQVAGGAAPVAWLPYFGGSIAASDYYIVGGITELNYNIRSGGAELRVGQVGPRARTYTQSVAIDLRIVDTRSLLVVRAISLAKQVTGYEIGFNTFRFFGSELFDINLGAKAQEPLQLGIRTALEEATLRLVGAVTRQDPSSCMGKPAAGPGAIALEWAGLHDAGPLLAGHAAGAPVGQDSRVIAVAFEIDAPAPQAAAELADRIARAARDGALELELIARDSEPTDPARRRALTDRRLAEVIGILRATGVSPDGIRLMWRPAPGDAALHRATPGFQRIARLHVSP
ncbi:MAG: CsgG/HfaB family protein [Sphingomonas sp.]